MTLFTIGTYYRRYLLNAVENLDSSILDNNDDEAVVEHGDERLDINTIYTSWSGIMITATSAGISIIASAVVMRLIYRSAKGLKNSAYHRILFGMSAADIVQSLALAFTTLPMPKDMIYTNYQGLILGNNASCLTQGFMVCFGVITGLMYNAMLSLYYLCFIRYNMSNEDFARWIEPLLHGVSVVTGLTTASVYLSYTSYHPSPISFTWCGLGDAYPYWCNDRACVENAGIDPGGTIRGLGAKGKLIVYVTAGFSLTIICILVTSMALIVITVRDQQLRMNSKNSAPTGSTEARVHSRQARILANTKIVRKQAIAYTLINIFGFVMAIVLPASRYFSQDRYLPPPATFQIFFLIFRPLQGLLNSIVFIYHKASDYQRANRLLLFRTAVREVLNGGEEHGDGRVVSDLLLLRQHSFRSRLRFAFDSYESESSEVDESVEIGEKIVGGNDNGSTGDCEMIAPISRVPSIVEASLSDASLAGESDQNTLSGFSIVRSTDHASISSGNLLSNNDKSPSSMQLPISNGITGYNMSPGTILSTEGLSTKSDELSSADLGTVTHTLDEGGNL